MARVLVTGASGFIGSHLIATLVARGDRVTALVRKTSCLDRLESLGASLAYGDVTDPASLRGVVAGQSVVYHLAGLIRSLGTSQLYTVNGEGVHHIAEACADRPKPPVLVVVSSLAAAGPSPNGRLRTEGDAPSPVSHYGRSKRAGEQAAERFADRVPITIVRPPIVFGEADRTSLPLFKSVARSRVHLVPGYVPRRFSMIHVADLADLLIRAAEQGARLAPSAGENGPSNGSGYYFGACNEHPTYYQLGGLLGKALGCRWTLPIPFATPVLWLVGAVGDLIGRTRGREVFLGIDKVREATAGAWACSPEKARHELGFSVRTSLAERLRQSAEWYREKGWL